MKNTLLGLVIGFGVFAILSYKTTDNEPLYGSTRVVTNKPLKQKKVLLVYSQEKANEYLAKGWIVQDVDVTFDTGGNIQRKIFTLILY